MESRRRKKDYVGGLESRVSDCTKRNQELNNKLKELERQNETLMSQLKRLQDVVRNTTSKTTQAATCMMVLLLSCGLILAPNYGPFSIRDLKTEDNESNDVVSSLTSGHRNRNLLDHAIVEDSSATEIEPEVPIVDFAKKPEEFSVVPHSDEIYHQTDSSVGEMKAEIAKISPHMKLDQNDTASKATNTESISNNKQDVLPNVMTKAESSILDNSVNWPEHASPINVHGNRGIKRQLDRGPHDQGPVKLQRTSRLDEI